MIQRLQTAIAITAVFAGTYLMTRLGGKLIAVQVTDPLAVGKLWPVILLLAVGSVWLGGTVIIGVTMQLVSFINSDAGHETDRLGVAGVCGTVAAVLVGAGNTLLQTPVFTATGGSLTPLVSTVTAAMPLIVGFSWVWRSEEKLYLDSTSENPDLDPEVIKQATELGDADSSPRPGVPYSVNHTDVKQGDSSVNTDPNHGQGITYTSYEYDWQQETDVSFADVGGLNDIKVEIQRELILPFAKAAEAANLGVSPANLLFYGPPGTGKTYLAKAVATELGLPAAILTGSAINSKWINESAEQVATLFSEAEKIATAHGGAVIFVDEIDSVLQQRSGASNAHAEDSKVVNEFLNHLEEADDNIVFIGATNRLGALDKAGIRAGRIDRKIEIGSPDRQTREAMLQAQLSDRDHSIPDELIEQIAIETEDYVAAELEQLVTKAAKHALQDGSNRIRIRDIVAILEK